MLSNKNPFVSYAQNQEDVLLWRLFQNTAEGFYVDVGAAHPEWESVTKAFYDRGWRGINLEPNIHFYAMLEKERPRDINIRALAGRETGERELHIVGQSGLSTASLENVDFLRAKGHAISHQETCKMVRLDDVFREHQAPRIQFLKVDAEGMEQQVLEGCSFSEFRPEVLVIEATLPETNTRREDGVREYLSSRAYNFTFFDGLNDYYVATECVHLAEQLLWPVNILDNYLLSKEKYLEYRLAKTVQLQPQKRKFLLSSLFKRVTSLNRVASLCVDDVIWAYSYFLKREPESSEVVDGYISGCKNLRQLVETITGSKEYEYKKNNLSLSKSEHADLYYFFHIHKTGGMSVHEYLSDVLPKKKLFPGYFSEDLMSFGSLNDLSYLSGHFGNLPLMIKSRNLHLATTLREPLQRGVSHYKHILRAPGVPLYEEVTASSLEEFVFGPLGPLIFGNFQARLLAQLSSQWERFLNAFDTKINTSENLFELAMEGLEKMEIIGIKENLRDFITRLSKAWGLPLPTKDYHINSMPSNQLIGVSQCVEEKIRTLCAIDIKIYEQTIKKINI